LSANTIALIFLTPESITAAIAALIAGAVVFDPQKLRLKIACAIPATGLVCSNHRTPPTRPSR
jgi:hypothetical protein